MTALVQRDTLDVAHVQMSETASILQVIERAAANPLVDLDKMERLFEMRERVLAREARAAFEAALSLAKGEIGPIEKNRVVDFTSAKGRTNYRHEDFAEVARTVDPVLAQHGLSYRFRATSNANEPIVVTCIVSHRGGHSEETTLSAGRDESGNKNSIQAIGSTITYLQRYTLKAALGLAASNDDDAKKAETREDDRAISDRQRDALKDLIDEAGADIKLLCKHFGIEGIGELPSALYGDADRILREKIAKREKAEARS